MTVDTRYQAGRNVQIDVLRALAIVLVLLQHSAVEPTHWFIRVGWSGVDLFFVLSGFLVTGLLFMEVKRYGRCDIGRFLLRRGLKIYPPFWLLVGATLLLHASREEAVEFKTILSELLFLQNYGPALWPHTWSLAVEEHFYLLLAGVFAAWGARAQAVKLRLVMGWTVAGLLAILMARCAVVVLVPVRFKLTVRGTHAHLDALIFGAFLAYLHHFHLERLISFIGRWRLALVASGITLLGIVYCVGNGPHSFFVKTVGCTLVYVAFGALFTVALYSTTMNSSYWGSIAKIGQHSYSIYLWHLPLTELFIRPMAASVAPWARVLMVGPGFVLTSIAAGCLLGSLLERPFLRLRDRLVPSRIDHQHRAQSLAGSAVG